VAPLAVASAFFIATLLEQQAPVLAILALSEQQADLAWLQVLASPACKAGMKAKAANVKETISLFIIFVGPAVTVKALNPLYIPNQTPLSKNHSKYCIHRLAFSGIFSGRGRQASNFSFTV
jgi:hypothetical protein